MASTPSHMPLPRRPADVRERVGGPAALVGVDLGRAPRSSLGSWGIPAWALLATGLGACVHDPADTKPGDSAVDTAPETGDSGPGAGWTSVEVDSGREACGLTSDGRILCWGEVPQEEPPPPSGGWSELSYFSAVGCVADPAGVVECWWSQHNEWADRHLRHPPDEPLHHISVGAYFGCGFNEEGALRCWGEPDVGDWTVPEGEWKAVDVGGEVACAIGADGGLECWGFKTFHDRTANYASVSVGYRHIVGLDERGVVHCFPGGYRDTCEVPEGVRFRTVDAGNEATCGITTDGEIVCWASESGYKTSYEVGPDDPQPGPWLDVGVGRAGVCAVRGDGEMVCFVDPVEGYLANIPDPG